MAGARWATFDCYGTLIDWNAGISAVLARLFGAQRAPELLTRYHELEPEVQGEEYRSYAAVLRLTLERLAAEADRALTEDEAAALVGSLPEWPPFPEVPGSLEELRRHGWKLAVLSNSDRGLIAASQRALGVEFDAIVVAEDTGSYKPAHSHWLRFAELAAPAPGRHVHVAASHFHDIVPARVLGLRSVWINRLGEAADPSPTRELPDLTELPATLEELAPA